MQPTYTMPDFDQAFLYALQYQDMSATFTQFRAIFCPSIEFCYKSCALFTHSLSIFVKVFANALRMNAILAAYFAFAVRPQ